MEYKTLDMGSYKRKQHFEYFSGLAFPYVGTTAPVDITALREKIRRERLSYTSLIQPVPVPADSNPRITFGKFYAQGEKTLLPVSLLCNHALADGLHIAAFYRQLEREIEALCAQA